MDRRGVADGLQVLEPAHERALELVKQAGLCRIDERRPHPKLRARLPVLW